MRFDVVLYPQTSLSFECRLEIHGSTLWSDQQPSCKVLGWHTHTHIDMYVAGKKNCHSNNLQCQMGTSQEHLYTTINNNNKNSSISIGFPFSNMHSPTHIRPPVLFRFCSNTARLLLPANLQKHLPEFHGYGNFSKVYPYVWYLLGNNNHHVYASGGETAPAFSAFSKSRTNATSRHGLGWVGWGGDVNVRCTCTNATSRHGLGWVGWGGDVNVRCTCTHAHGTSRLGLGGVGWGC